MKKYPSFAPLPGLAWLLFLLASCQSGPSANTAAGDSSNVDTVAVKMPSLEKKWETDTSIRTPESVLWDEQQKIFYVSDINGDGNARDGNGFISKLGADGTIRDLHWVDGLNAPKGMGMYNGELYVADLDQLVIIDIQAKKIKKKIKLPGAVFLNDIAVDNDGNVYISDTRLGKVFLYHDGQVSVYLDAPEAKGANGLLVWNGQLWMLGAGGIYRCNMQSRQTSLFSEAVNGGDGLTAVNDSELIASRWNGEVYYVKADGSASKLLDTQADHKNTADLFYLASEHLLVIPTFTGNCVMGYTLQTE